MTWHKPTQTGFGEIDFTRWQSNKAVPVVKAKDKLPDTAPPVAPMRTRAVGRSQSRVAQTHDQDQFNRTHEAKVRIAARVSDGEDYHTARKAVIRELWPEEFDQD